MLSEISDILARLFSQDCCDRWRSLVTRLPAKLGAFSRKHDGKKLSWERSGLGSQQLPQDDDYNFSPKEEIVFFKKQEKRDNLLGLAYVSWTNNVCLNCIDILTHLWNPWQLVPWESLCEIEKDFLPVSVCQVRWIGSNLENCYLILNIKLRVDLKFASFSSPSIELWKA